MTHTDAIAATIIPAGPAQRAGDRRPLLKAGMTGFCIAVGLITATTGTDAAELGRLFFTPEQRMQLESGQPQGDGTPGSSHSLTVNGIVQKKGGQRTVWINGVPQPAGKSDEDSPESVPVAVPGQSQPVKVKVGQKVLINPQEQ